MARRRTTRKRRIRSLIQGARAQKIVRISPRTGILRYYTPTRTKRSFYSTRVGANGMFRDLSRVARAYLRNKKKSYTRVLATPTGTTYTTSRMIVRKTPREQRFLRKMFKNHSRFQGCLTVIFISIKKC